MNLIIAFLATLFAASQGFAIRTQIQESFSEGLPRDFIYFDNDQNTPSSSMKKLGFDVGVPWVCFWIEDEDNYVACSTSWYKPTGKSDDWMILHPISVEQGATLKWRAMASDSKNRDGYAIYVSSEGSDIQKFDIENPLFVIAEEETEWVSHSIDLSAFVGKEIWIAFVNNSDNKSRLFIDDIYAGTPLQLDIQFDMPVMVGPEEPVSVKGKLIRELDTPLQGINLTCEWDDGTSQTIQLEGSLTKDSPLAFEFTDLHFIEIDENREFKVTASANGIRVDRDFRVFSSFRPMVIEEFTGTWCSFCVRGIVALEELKQKLGKNAIALAVHIDDVMALPEYQSHVMEYLSSNALPNCIVNRKFEGDPSDWANLMQRASDEKVGCTLSAEIDADLNSEKIKVNTSSVFSSRISDADYSLTYILKENNIHHPENLDYAQKNAYSGGRIGPMGGFENMPSVIIPDNIWYQDVVIGVSESPMGIQGSVPHVLEAALPYYHSYTMDFPEKMTNIEETLLVILMIDNRTREIVNAREYNLKDFTIGNGIDMVDSEEPYTDLPLKVYSIDGTFVGEFADRNYIYCGNIPAGIYVIRYGDKSEKIILR
ncbi:MAG: choice-of-anchor J domain-containing protein [Muribaculaceae bacterium]|nr:choice-of-anchor J domain-containing protein [Muribaculaceae bacterium]